jgi:hypothetical protein
VKKIILVLLAVAFLSVATVGTATGGGYVCGAHQSYAPYYYYAPQPVVYMPQPVYYVAPRVYVAPQPAYVVPYGYAYRSGYCH